MPKSLDYSRIDLDTQAAILELINRAPHDGYLTSNGWLRDDPILGYGEAGYGIGHVVAPRLLALRDSQPDGELRDISLLTQVKGFAQDKLDDLAFTMSNHALHRNRVTLITDGPGCRQAILDVIGRATRYVHLSTFMFFNDEAGQLVADSLIEAASRDVDVRVMFDIRKSRDGSTDGKDARKNNTGRHKIDELVNRLENGRVEVVDTAWLGHRLSEDQLKGLVDQGMNPDWAEEQRDINRHTLIGLNHVDHTKLLIVDGREAMVMSIGIGNEYLYEGQQRIGTETSEPHWHDAITHIVGGASARVNLFFAKRWMLSTNKFIDVNDVFFTPPAVPEGTDTVLILESRPGEELQVDLPQLLRSGPLPLRQDNALRHFYSRQIFRRAKEILIGNPYPIDYAMLRTWLEEIEGRDGLSFRLIRPHPSANDFPFADTGAVKSLFRSFDKELRDAGARIFEYSRAFNHLKIAVVDGWLATHGSYNLNWRSARKDLEFNVIIESRAYAEQVRNVLLSDMGDNLTSEIVNPVDEDVFSKLIALNPGTLAILNEVA